MILYKQISGHTVYQLMGFRNHDVVVGLLSVVEMCCERTRAQEAFSTLALLDERQERLWTFPTVLLKLVDFRIPLARISVRVVDANEIGTRVIFFSS